MILAVRTDSPDAFVGLYGTDGELIEQDTWRADRTLARDLLAHIDTLLRRTSASWKDVDGIVAYRGPGSFTGLRIGLTVANTVAYARSCPIVGEQEDDWINHGLARLRSNENDGSVMPLYDAPPRITSPRS